MYGQEPYPRDNFVRVSYNGYYVTFPRLRQEFDSPYPHHL